MPDLDLGPDEFKSDRKPYRLTNQKTALKMAIPALALLALGTWGAMTMDEWWAVFAPWPALIGLGAIVGYAVPQFFFDEDD